MITLTLLLIDNYDHHHNVVVMNTDGLTFVKVFDIPSTLVDCNKRLLNISVQTEYLVVRSIEHVPIAIAIFLLRTGPPEL